MPPKKNISQKQKQKKAKQQQQQQQNIKINVRVGDSRKRAPRKSSGKKQPITTSIQAPIIQQAPYIPMFLNQQPAQYFTPPVASGTLPITPPTTVTAPITTTTTTPTSTIIPLPRTRIPSPRTSIPIPISPPTRPSSSTAPTITRATPAPSIELDTFTNFGPSQNAISNLVGFTDLDEPTPFSFGNRSTFYSAINEFNDYTDFGTQTDTIPQPPLTFIRRAGTQTDESPTFIRRAGTQTTPIGQSDIETQFEPAFTIAYQNELATQTEPTFQREFETQTTPIGQFDAETQTGRRYVSSSETQTTPTSLREFGTQFEDFMPQVPDVIPTAVSSTLREMETQTDEFIPRPLPLPPTMPSFMAPTQDIQPSGIQNIVNLTQENLAKFGGLSSVMPRGVSEISDLTEGTSRSINTDISNFIQQEAMRRAGSRVPIEETLKQQKEESKKRAEESGMFGQMRREMDKRRQFLQPPEDVDPAVEPGEWDDEPKQPARRKVGEKMEVKQEEILQREEDIKTIIDKYEADIEERTQNIEFWRDQIRNMKEMGIQRDMTGMTVEDYEQEIGDNEGAISFYESELESLKERIPSKSTEKQPYSSRQQELFNLNKTIEMETREIDELTNKLNGAEVMKTTYNRKKIKLLESGEDVDEDGYSVSRYDKLIEDNKKEITKIKKQRTRKMNSIKELQQKLSIIQLEPIQEEDELSFQPLMEEGVNVEFEE